MRNSRSLVTAQQEMPSVQQYSQSCKCVYNPLVLLDYNKSCCPYSYIRQKIVPHFDCASGFNLSSNIFPHSFSLSDSTSLERKAKSVCLMDSQLFERSCLVFPDDTGA